MRIGAATAALAAALCLAASGCGEAQIADEPDSRSPAAAKAGAPARWRALTPSTIGRTEVSAARIGDAVYVIGGFAEPDGLTSDIVERYDLRLDRWTRAAPIPIAVNHAAAVAYRGSLYVVGGYTAANGLSDETSALQRYDPQTARWTRLRDAPTTRGAHVAGVIGKRMYVAGGAVDGKALGRLEIYDFETDRWSRGPSMRLAREHLAAAVHDDKLYAIAGRAAGKGNFRVVERYAPARRRWERVPKLRTPRGGIAAATVAGRIVVVGGEEAAGTIDEVESYNPRTRRWRFRRRLPTPRHGLGAIAHKGSIYVLEGGPTPGLSYSRRAEALRIAP